jgi:hypothetical protein
MEEQPPEEYLFEFTVPDVYNNELILSEYLYYPTGTLEVSINDEVPPTYVPAEPIPMVTVSINDKEKAVITQEQAQHLILLLKQFVQTGKLI